MVKIPDKPYGYVSSALPDARLAGDPGPAKALAMLADAGGKVAGVLADLRERSEQVLFLEAQNRWTAGKAAYTQEAEHGNEEAGKPPRIGDAARGYTQDHAAHSRGLSGETLAWLKARGAGGQALQRFRDWSDKRAIEVSYHASGYEHREMTKHAHDMFNQRVRSIMDYMDFNPTSFGKALDDLNEVIGQGVKSGLFRQQEGEALFISMRDKMGKEAFEQHYALDRAGAIKHMEGYHLTPAEQARAKKRYQADLKADGEDSAVSRAFAAALEMKPQDAIRTLSTPEGRKQLGVNVSQAEKALAQLHAHHTHARGIEAQEREKRTEAFMTQVVNTAMGVGGKADPAAAVRMVQGHPDLDGPTRLKLLNALARGGVGSKDDPLFVADMTKRIVTEGETPVADSELAAGVASGQLTPGGMKRLQKFRDEVADPETGFLVKRAFAALKNGFARDLFAAGTPEHATAQLAAETALWAAVEQGKKDKNLAKILSPQSKDYVVGPIMQQYKLTLEQGMAARMRALTGDAAPPSPPAKQDTKGAAPPSPPSGDEKKDAAPGASGQVQDRLPGETPKAYLERRRAAQ